MKMKKTKILGLVLALIMFFTNLPFGSGIVHAEAGDIEINDTNFPDPIFKEYVKKEFDTINPDGKLSKAERDAVQRIDVRTKNYNSERISSLKGIEYFTNLEDLNCAGNRIIKLDLSNNKLLTKLDCNSNTTITELNLTGLTKLKSINCSYNNISDLDLSTCTGLTDIDCSINSFTNLNLSNCINLINFACLSSKLEKLDISNCKAIKEVNCANNSKLKELKLGNNSALISLICSNTKITNLDISNCVALEKVDCSESSITEIKTGNNLALTNLICWRNNLRDIDISGCTALKELRCESNNITNLDLSSNINLSELNCSRNGLTKLKLENNKNLTKLTCNDNDLEDLQLDNNIKIETINCMDNKLTKLNLSNNANLKSLILSNNKLTSLDLSTNKNLSYLVGEGQISSLTLEEGTDKIETSMFEQPFDLNRVEDLKGAEKDISNNAIKLNEGVTSISYKYKAKEKRYIKVTININYTGKTVVVPDPVSPGVVADGRVRITFDAGKYNTIDGNNRFKYLDVLKGTSWSNSDLSKEIPKTTIPESRGIIFNKWEPDIPETGSVEAKEFKAGYKERVFNPNKLEKIEVSKQPYKMEYLDGEPLEIADLVIKLIDEDGGSKIISYGDFKDNDINVDLKNGDILKLSDNNRKIIISKGDIQTETEALIVKPKLIIGPVKQSIENPDTEKYCTVIFESEDTSKGTVDEKNTFYVLKTANKKLSELIAIAPEVNPVDGNNFNGWRSEPEQRFDSEIKGNIKVKALFSKLEAIIGPKDPTKDEGVNPNPEKYYSVTFKSEANGKVAAENTFYVLKTAGKKMSDIKVPVTTEIGNYVFDKWDPVFNENTAIDRNLEFTAKFTALPLIVGPVNTDDLNTDKLKAPEKYFTVTFKSEDTSKVSVSPLNTYYVLKTANLKLSDINAPKTEGIGNYAFDRWEPAFDANKVINENLDFTAKFKEKEEIQEPTDPKIIGPVDPNAPGTVKPSPNEYWTVTFESEDAKKGTVDGANTFYIPMNENKKLSDLNLDLLKVKANPGFKFVKWDPALDGTIINGDKVIKAIFTADGTKPPVNPNNPNNPQDPSNPPKPNNPDPQVRDYWIIRFLSDNPYRGYIGYDDTVRIEKNRGYRIEDLARFAPEAIPYSGYEFAGWSPYLYGNQAFINEDMYIYARFEEIYVPRYSYERRRPRRIDDDRDDRDDSKEEKPVEVNEYDKLEAILFINDYVMQKSVNGVVSQVRMDIAPFIYQARTMLPIRYVAESLGFMVTWDANTRTVYLVDKENIVQIPVDTNNIIVNGKAFVSDVKPMIKNNRTMLPVANVARALGLQDGKDILWDAAMKFVTLRRNVLK